MATKVTYSFDKPERVYITEDGGDETKLYVVEAGQTTVFTFCIVPWGYVLIEKEVRVSDATNANS